MTILPVIAYVMMYLNGLSKLEMGGQWTKVKGCRYFGPIGPSA